MSGLGGIVLAARLNSVDLNAGGGTLLIDAIAAAVIGGTSLFGGRGEIRNALIGAAMISTVSNGMFILGYTTGIIFIVTGAILLLAVTFDTVVRRLQVTLRPLARIRDADDPVGPDVAEPHRRAVRVAHGQLGDARRPAEAEVDARILRREVARSRVHLPHEPCARRRTSRSRALRARSARSLTSSQCPDGPCCGAAAAGRRSSSRRRRRGRRCRSPRRRGRDRSRAASASRPASTSCAVRVHEDLEPLRVLRRAA